MVATIVKYELAASLRPEKVLEFYDQAVPKFTGMPGLIRKYFVISEDGKFGGSVYLWESREQALAFHSESWKQFIQGKYGQRPQVTILDCPIVIDNVSGEVIQS